MITENISTLKIHKLTQAQYDREVASGNIDVNALYLTPDEEIDLSNITGTLSIEKGGTGGDTKEKAILNLGAMDLTSDQTVSSVKTFSNGIKIGNASLTYDSTKKMIVISVS